MPSNFNFSSVDHLKTGDEFEEAPGSEFVLAELEDDDEQETDDPKVLRTRAIMQCTRVNAVDLLFRANAV